MSDETEAVEVLPPMGAASELISLGHALMKAENDSIQAIAVQRPRDERKVLDGALAELTMAPQYAEEVYYSIPYEDKRNRDPKTGKPRITFVEGLSIGAAMSLLRRWGNAAATARVLAEDADGYLVEGVCIDYETNVRVSRPHRALKKIKLRDGGLVKMSEQKQLMALQASASKAMRNAVLAILPEYLKRSLFNKAKVLAAGEAAKPADEKKVAGIIHGFSRWGITEQRLAEKIGKPTTEWLGGDVALLIGLGQAIRDGELTIDEAFSSSAPQDGPAVATPATLTPEAIQAGAVTAHNDAKRDPIAERDAQAAEAPKARGKEPPAPGSPEEERELREASELFR